MRRRGAAAWLAMHHGNVAASRRVRPAEPSWTFQGTTFLRSDGLAGSYAEAATSALARVVFPGTGAPVATVSMWVTPTAWSSGKTLLDVSDDGAPRAQISTNDDFGTTALLANAAGTSDSASGGTEAATLHVVLVADGTDFTLYENGVNAYFDISLPAEPYAAVDLFRLFADYAGAQRVAADIRSLAVFGRALSSGEVAALYAGDYTLDLRTVSGAYDGATNGPEHWYPADGDTGTTVTDRGSVGGCNLNLHGGMTIEVDP